MFEEFLSMHAVERASRLGTKGRTPNVTGEALPPEKSLTACEKDAIKALPRWLLRQYSHHYPCPHNNCHHDCMKGERTTKCEQHVIVSDYEYLIKYSSMDMFFMRVLGLQRGGVMRADIVAILHGHTTPVLIREVEQSERTY